MNNTITKEIKCEYCGEVLEGEEQETPRRDHDDNAICDYCFEEHFQFTCARCQEYGLLSERDGIGSLFIIVDGEEAGMPEGAYKILSHPYWWSDMFSMWLRQDAIQKVSDNTFGVNADNYNYAVAHLCAECQSKVGDELNRFPATAEKEPQ